MAYNGVLLNALLMELQKKLVGGRINKIYQPSDKELTFTIRNHGKNQTLYLTAHSNYAHVNIIDSKLDNPTKPPNFCMLMRKHLQNGFITKIEQKGLERILVIHIDSSDELGYVTTKRLIVEIMGKHSNIILINEDNVIYDSIKRISPYMSKVRQIMPNQPFKFLEYDKENLINLTEENFYKKMENNPEQKTSRYIFMTYEGFGPNLAKEICNRCDISFRRKNKLLTKEEQTKLFNTLREIKEIIINKKYIPYLILNENTGDLVEFSPIYLSTYSGKEYSQLKMNSFSSLIDRYYSEKIAKNAIKQKSSNLTAILSKRINSLSKKIAKLKEELKTAQNADEYQLKGELLTANIYKMKKGMKSIEVENYYDNNKPITIELKENKSPADNAQLYFKKYNKLQHAQVELQKQLKKSQEELDYCEAIMNSIEIAEDTESIDEIKEELIEAGYINKKSKQKKKKKQMKDYLKEYKSSDGFTIYAGKNNKQNDYLTLKLANNDDIWLHTKDIPGTHVIIVKAGRKIPQLTLDEAAIIAAYNSKGKMSSNVPVDYTEVKNVSKPSGAKPGKVIYVNNKTLYVTPKVKIVNRLQDNAKKDN
ncbi:MAG TPA: NFACT RNA binding domain-containing protein [Clostridia bacterium]|nr:NFACT RNA binding domain-containing protein [Clostridia bacterium]